MRTSTGASVGDSKKQSDSPVWADLLKVQECYDEGRVWRLGNGKKIDFWSDKWCGLFTLKEKCPELYMVCKQKSGSVAKFANSSWRLEFTRWLDEQLQNQLSEIRNILCTVSLSDADDMPKWLWEGSGKFSVKSMYDKLCTDELEARFRIIWNAKLPLKIKIFMWQMYHEATLTKDTMLRKNWHADAKCAFCDQDENIEHLFFKCGVIKYVWSLIAQGYKRKVMEKLSLKERKRWNRRPSTTTQDKMEGAMESREAQSQMDEAIVRQAGKANMHWLTQDGAFRAVQYYILQSMNNCCNKLFGVVYGACRVILEVEILRLPSRIGIQSAYVRDAGVFQVAIALMTRERRRSSRSTRYAMSPAAGSRKRSRSASAVVADTASGYHVLRIKGYSLTKGTPTGEYLKSLPFTVGGHRWYLRYYPNGTKSESADYISLFVCLADSVAKPVKAQFNFRFIGHVAEHSLTMGQVYSFENQSNWGHHKFMTREDLEKSTHLQDDSFAIQCDVVVIHEFQVEEETLEEDMTPAFVSVSPSDLHHHLGDLLSSEKGADVVFNVGGQTFAAHRCVLAARSPVFSAELFGIMKEGDTGCVVQIDDMEAGVFKALLRFIYTDVFPEVKTEAQDQDEEDVMAQHLLVAADRYNMERLKQICEEKLCKYIDVGTVGTILELADQHHCPGLKKACFHFLSSSENLKAAVASNAFEHLSKSCPYVMRELVAMLANLVRVANASASFPYPHTSCLQSEKTQEGRRFSGSTRYAMSSAAGSRKRSRSGSAIVADTESGYHVLRISGHSRTKGTPTGEHLKSLPFTVGGHRWQIRYYPNGDTSESADYISLFLRLANSVTKPVKAQFSFVGGIPKFFKREDLEKSTHLQDDSFAIRCDVVVIDEFRVEKETLEEDMTPSFVSVSPSDLHQHLGDLLLSEKGADVVFNVGGQTFAAHRCVLAARSPVFSAELFGIMKEGDTGCVVQIDDMEAGVFKSLLRFIYTDMFPEVKKEGQDQDEEDVMAQHLLVAADRYNLERLKQICEEKLIKYIDVGTVGSILVLADQHNCPGLKKACFHFLSSSVNLKAAVASNDFEHLSTSCPSVMRELVVMIGNLVP
ncbi:hypothetical protein EJB05_22272, partial [Eragrostis curvula]